MAWLRSLIGLLTGGTAARVLDIALEKTEDADKRNELVLEYFRLREETRRAEINRATVPWVDALHKMGRQIFWLAALAAVAVLIALGRGPELKEYAEFFFTAAAGGGVYTLLKGRGR